MGQRFGIYTVYIYNNLVLGAVIMVILKDFLVCTNIPFVWMFGIREA
jgi:hypothetical protein